MHRENAAREGRFQQALELAKQRLAMREAGDYAEADRLRDEILAMGFVVEDSPEGPRLRPAD